LRQQKDTSTMSYRIKVGSKSPPTDEAQLLNRMERLAFLVQEHRQGIWVGVTVLLAAVAAVAAIIWVDHRNAEQALNLNAQAMRLYLDRPPDQRVKADENLKQTIKVFRQLVEQYPRVPSAPLTLYYLGNALVQVNDLGGAIEAYKKFIVLYGANRTLLGLVYQRLGYAYLLNGDRDQAVKAFVAVLDLDVVGAFNKDHALFELGKLEETQSRPEGALARYQELTKGYPTSPLASEAAVRIKALQVKREHESGATEGREGTATVGEPGK
jgi:tetratricopeptide (TPR) repeat protein